MLTDLILSNFDQYVDLNDAEKDHLLSLLIVRPFKRGERIVSAGDPAKFMMFVNSGYLMTTYIDANGTEHVLQFSAMGWWATDIHSATSLHTTPYDTKALTNGEALLLPRLALKQLLETYPKFERYFRIVFQGGLIRQQRRYIEAFSTSAEERYRSFISAYPTIIQDIPQKYIASYLGITPEFLSKIRGKMANQS